MRTIIKSIYSKKEGKGEDGEGSVEWRMEWRIEWRIEEMEG
jgi:hypothetical protein